MNFQMSINSPKSEPKSINSNLFNNANSSPANQKPTNLFVNNANSLSNKAQSQPRKRTNQYQAQQLEKLAAHQRTIPANSPIFNNNPSSSNPNPLLAPVLAKESPATIIIDNVRKDHPINAPPSPQQPKIFAKPQPKIPKNDANSAITNLNSLTNNAPMNNMFSSSSANNLAGSIPNNSTNSVFNNTANSTNTSFNNASNSPLNNASTNVFNNNSNNAFGNNASSNASNNASNNVFGSNPLNNVGNNAPNMFNNSQNTLTNNPPNNNLPNTGVSNTPIISNPVNNTGNNAFFNNSTNNLTNNAGNNPNTIVGNNVANNGVFNNTSANNNAFNNTVFNNPVNNNNQTNVQPNTANNTANVFTNNNTVPTQNNPPIVAGAFANNTLSNQGLAANTNTLGTQNNPIGNFPAFNPTVNPTVNKKDESQLQFEKSIQTVDDYIKELKDIFASSYEDIRKIAEDNLKSLDERQQNKRIILNFEEVDRNIGASSNIVQKTLENLERQQEFIANNLQIMSRKMGQGLYTHELSDHLQQYGQLKNLVFELEEDEAEWGDAGQEQIISMFQSLNQVELQIKQMNELVDVYLKDA